MSVKAIVKKYQHSVNGITVNNREAARVLQRSLRAEGALPNDTKIVQRVLIERYVR